MTAPTQTTFDVCATLPSGTTVLEASAGTGKTYTIAALAARYVAEGHAQLGELMLVTFGRMATWTAQLQSIQRLGSRLSGLTDVREIGHAIATELRQLIDYHNVRVYRTHGEDLIPVAMLGHGAVYSDETVENLRVAVGEGVTGWVAKYRVPQLVDDTANDPRVASMLATEGAGPRSYGLTATASAGSAPDSGTAAARATVASRRARPWNRPAWRARGAGTAAAVRGPKPSR